MKISILAEDLKKQRFQISNFKRSDNFEIQKLRNSITIPFRKRYYSKSRFESTI